MVTRLTTLRVELKIVNRCTWLAEKMKSQCVNEASRSRLTGLSTSFASWSYRGPEGEIFGCRSQERQGTNLWG